MSGWGKFHLADLSSCRGMNQRLVGRDKAIVGHYLLDASLIRAKIPNED
jgi:hypothetical protein